jgi:hypothetical protein
VIRRLFLLGVVAAVLVGGDVAARGFVSATVEHRAQQEAPSGSSVSASVGGFPFLPPLLLGGDVSRASVHVENLKAQALLFSSVAIDLHGVHLDRGRLINDRKARITKIDHGTIRAVVTEAALSDALHGVPVTMSPGELRVAGARVSPRAAGGKLVIGAFAVPSTDYMPCVSDFSINEGEMELSCQIHAVPPALLDAVEHSLEG